MKKELVVVGIGSSAGGLEALQKFFGSLVDIENLAFIVAQHLSPTHKSMMVELLQRVTSIPVLEIKNGLVIKAKTIYITPENTDIYVKDGKIYLKSIHQTFGPKPSVNYFFTSLAEDYKERAIGIILSGTGSDGSYGIRAIKAEGGITIAQSPNSSKYDGMPVSAINTGKVDTIIPIENMATEVKRLALSIDSKDINQTLSQTNMQNLFKILFEETSVDFSEYKKSTVTRRIARRMAALKIDQLSDYIVELEKNVDEVKNLYNDILIGVTSFFRDRKSFDAMSEYLKDLLAKKEAGEEIRIWTIGCSTGEEAYTIAMLLNEILQEKISHYKIKIFATDIDEESLKIARSGIYSEDALMELEKTLVNRYFRVLKHQYEIKKELRELIVFSKHNIISDSPFLRLDLVTCRNMLIYFSSELQSRIFPLIHYALNDNALLFLGKSESVGENSNLFNIIDRIHKIFKAQYIGTKTAPKIFRANITSEYYKPDFSKKKKSDLEALNDLILHAKDNYLLNKSVIINASNEIIYTKGDIPYLNFPEGKTTNNIFKVLDENLSMELRTLIHRAYKNKNIETSKFTLVNLFELVQVYVRMIVTPVDGLNSEEIFYVIFFQTEKQENLSGFVSTDELQDESVMKLKDDLDTTKAHLQNVIEELETSYEETQSLNEELQSSNEELQSSNEELETTNEELQSTNEELQTAYAELKMIYNEKDEKNKRLEELTQKLRENTQSLKEQQEVTEAIINSAPVAITMVDENGFINFANDIALKLFGLSKTQILNKSYDATSWNITSYDDKMLTQDEFPFMIIKKTYEKVFDVKHAIIVAGNKLYLSISGAPLFDVEGRFKGAVFIILDNTKEVVNSLNLKAYQKSIEDSHKIVDALKERKDISMGNSFEIFQQAIGSLNLEWRNELHQITLYFDTLKQLNEEKMSAESQMLLDKIEKSNKNLSNKLYSLENFFIHSLIDTNTSNIKILKESIKIFEISFLELQIEIIDMLHEDDAFIVQNHHIKNIYFQVIEYILYIKKEFKKDEKSLLHLKSSKKKITFILDVCIEDTSIQKDKATQNLIGEFQKYFNNEITIECSGKSLHVGLQF